MSRVFESTTPTYLSGSFAPVTTLPLTIACWAYRTTETGSQTIWTIDDSGNAGNNIYVVSQGSGDGDVNFNDNWTGTSDSEVGWTINAWVPIIVTITSSEISLWIDGTNTAPVSHTVSIPTLNQFAVAQWPALGNDFDGRLEHIAAWNIELSDDNIAEFGAGFSPLLIRPDALQYYCECMGNSGSGVEIDLVGGNALTPSGDSGWAAGVQPFYSPCSGWSPSISPAGGGGGLSIPIAAYHYNHSLAV